ncbi:dihydrofolate reductase [Flavobacterium sp.]|uniref:dihydrofolate reductase n=1 Tax=Flavobacterium sp. TaxID=239 RepID=UPI00262D2725|nr:dihydrofolate reductase [Flavobacterium sp.]
MITLIAAAGENNELGKDNDLLWHLPNDFKRFKTLTSGHYIIMGRKTFESFPKPLPNRTHIIITRNKNYDVPEGCFVVNSIEKALDICPKNETIYIIGGGEIYKQSIDLADCIELTRVHSTFEADAYFPEIDAKKWALETSEFHDKDEKHAFSFTFETYKKV